MYPAFAVSIRTGVLKERCATFGACVREVWQAVRSVSGEVVVQGNDCQSVQQVGVQAASDLTGIEEHGL